MKKSKFNSFLNSLSELTINQLQSLLCKASNLKTGAFVVAETVSKCESLSCPHCNSYDSHKWGKLRGLQRYRCKGCKKTYTALTGTPIANLHHIDLWMNYMGELIKGSTVHEAAASCRIDPKTSFRWRHRFLAMLDSAHECKLEGIIEMDETFFLNSKKGNKNLDRSARKRGGTASQRGRSKEHVAVVIGQDRSGHIHYSVMQDFNHDNLKSDLLDSMQKDVVLCTDSSPVYKALASRENLKHKPVNLSQGIRVIDGVYHIQHVNSYHSRLKKWIGKFHGVATKYLDHYVNWQRVIERTRFLADKSARWMEIMVRPDEFQHVSPK